MQWYSKSCKLEHEINHMVLNIGIVDNPFDMIDWNSLKIFGLLLDFSIALYLTHLSQYAYAVAPSQYEQPQSFFYINM